MSANSHSLTSQSRTLSELLESDDEFVDVQHYTSNYTRHRPPHLNHRNLPSAQMTGPMTDSSNAASDGLAARRGNIYHPPRYAPSPQSATESSTTAAMQPLTEQAVDVLNHANRAGSHGGGGNIREWINGGMFAAGDAEDANANANAGGSGSVLVLRSGSGSGRGPRSRVTISSARSIGSSTYRRRRRDRTDEIVFAAGQQFDHFSYPVTPDICCEDVVCGEGEGGGAAL